MPSATAYVFPLVCRCGETINDVQHWQQHLLRVVRSNDHGPVPPSPPPPAWSPPEVKDSPHPAPKPIHTWELVPGARVNDEFLPTMGRLTVPGGWVYVVLVGFATGAPVFVPDPDAR